MTEHGVFDKDELFFFVELIRHKSGQCLERQLVVEPSIPRRSCLQELSEPMNLTVSS